MKRSRFFMTTFVVLLILSFSLTTVGAQNEPLVSTEPLSVHENGPSPDVIIPDESGPYPITPMDGDYVYNRTPKFIFSRHSDATKYSIQVIDYNANPDQVVYEYSGPGTCGTAYCWFQPPIKLKTLKLEATSGGLYTWAVKAFIGNAWQPYSAPFSFMVCSTGFNSTFDVNTKNWKPLPGGTWTRTSTGYYKGLAAPGVSMGTLYAETFYNGNGVVYEVRMKRKVEESGFNRLIINSMPAPLVEYSLDEGYLIEYSNTGLWRVRKISSGVASAVVGPVASPYIEHYDWNTVTIWEHAPYIDIWMNGVYLGFLDGISIDAGYMGVGGDFTVNGAPLLVDSVKAYYSSLAPYALPFSASGEPDPAYNLTP